MKGINEMSTVELHALQCLMEEKKKAHEALPNEVVSAILNGLSAWIEAAYGRRRSKAGTISPSAGSIGR